MVIEFIGAEEKMKVLIPRLKEMITAGAMVVLDAEIVHNVCE
jgi:PII-like signaling protein